MSQPDGSRSPEMISQGLSTDTEHHARMIDSSDSARLIERTISRQLPSFLWASPVTIFDQELDHYQRDAVARALATPDFVMIQGPVGTGKTRVAIEISRQLISRQQRVLWLSPNSISLNKTHLHFSQINDIQVRRLFEPDEKIGDLAAACLGQTESHRFQQFVQQRSTQIRSQIHDLENRIRTVEPLIEVIRAAHQTGRELAERQAELARISKLQSSLNQDIEQEILEQTESSTYLVQRIRKLDQQHLKECTDHQSKHSAWAARETTAVQARDAAIAELNTLRPQLEAAKSGGIFSLTKWKAKLDGTLPARQQLAEQQLRDAETLLAAIAAEKAESEEAEKTRIDEYLGRRNRLFTEETDRRSKELNQQATEIQTAIIGLTSVHQEYVSRISHAGLSAPEDESTGDLVETITQQICQAKKRLAESRIEETHILEDANKEIDRWKNSCQITIGHFSVIRQLEGSHFDGVIIDDASRLTESDLLSAFRLADRRILLGEIPERLTRPSGTPPDIWVRLWHSLYHPRTWVTEGEHLVCRLHPLTAAERRKCDREPVADNPAIELRFATFLAEPLLAEVAFPANYQAVTAREFLYRELDELTIQPSTHSPIWENHEGRLTCRFSPPESDTVIAIYSGGITEEVRELDTRALHFDLAQGWTLETASQWLLERGLKRSPGRAILLQRAHRACSGLARWLNDAFRLGFVSTAIPNVEPHVEFLAVPDLRGRREPTPNRTGRPGGAGYEIALVEPKQRGLLADDLAKLLPDRGFVNLAEAQAIVQFLENHPSNSIRVTSPFPSQVIVLRHLIAKSRAAHVKVIDLDEVESNECDWLIVSLTRSHVSRAVTFGESPSVLKKLVSCARRKILFAGDPGTLSRRLQWEGPVDHLDATEAAHERNWVAALADCPRVSVNRHRPSPTSASN